MRPYDWTILAEVHFSGIPEVSTDKQDQTKLAFP